MLTLGGGTAHAAIELSPSGGACRGSEIIRPGKSGRQLLARCATCALVCGFGPRWHRGPRPDPAVFRRVDLVALAGNAGRLSAGYPDVVPAQEPAARHGNADRDVSAGDGHPRVPCVRFWPRA